MKKYIIKNADGSEQTVMRAIHNSRKEAGRVLMRYLSYNNESRDVDSHLSPFDFILEEVECGDINGVITDFNKARKALGIKPNADFYVVKRKHSEKVTHLENAARLALLENAARLALLGNVARLVTDINPKHLEALIALNKLFTIAQAWNKEDGFVSDFSDCEQDKWFPRFRYDDDAAGFVCADAQYTSTHYTLTNVAAFICSRLCFKTSERAEQFGKQFADLYNKVFL